MSSKQSNILEKDEFQNYGRRRSKKLSKKPSKIGNQKKTGRFQRTTQSTRQNSGFQYTAEQLRKFKQSVRRTAANKNENGLQAVVPWTEHGEVTLIQIRSDTSLSWFQVHKKND